MKRNKSRKVYAGILEGWFETGTEGIVWTLQEDRKSGYEGMHVLEKGDCLKIFGRDGKVIFADIINPDFKVGWAEYPGNPRHGQLCALGCWIHWTQIGWEPDDWAKLFLRGKKPLLRAELTTFK